MQIKANPDGASINQYLMKAAIPLGVYFIVEYLVRTHAGLNYILLSLLAMAMSVGTVILIYYIMKQLRDKVMSGKIPGFMAWTFGTQLMLFAGLIEAAFIYIYNEYIVPTNLATLYSETISQYENVMSQLETIPNKTGVVASLTEMMQENLTLLKETPVATPIETAVSMLSTDIFYGMILMAFIAPMIKKK